eukprot:89543_1
MAQIKNTMDITAKESDHQTKKEIPWEVISRKITKYTEENKSGIKGIAISAGGNGSGIQSLCGRLCSKALNTILLSAGCPPEPGCPKFCVEQTATCCEWRTKVTQMTHPHKYQFNFVEQLLKFASFQGISQETEKACQRRILDLIWEKGNTCVLKIWKKGILVALFDLQRKGHEYLLLDMGSCLYGLRGRVGVGKNVHIALGPDAWPDVMI